MENAFCLEVLKMLEKEGKINEDIVQNLLSLRNGGFNVHFGEQIKYDDEEGLEGLRCKYLEY